MSLHSILSPQADADANTVGILYIRRRLGADDYKARRLVNFVSLLVGEKGFPPPLPCLKAGKLEEAVTMKSQWLRHAVEAWLNDFLPPDNAMSVDRTAKANAAHEMDEAANSLGRRNLRVVAGGRS